MGDSVRNLSFNRSFREGLSELLEPRNLAILITVPMLVALASLVEGKLEIQGTIGPFSRYQTVRMLVWNVAVMVSLMATIRGGLTLGRLWRFEKTLSGGDAAGHVLGTVLSLFLCYFGVLCVMGAAVMLATQKLDPSGFLFLAVWCTPVLFWGVSLSSLLSLLADGPGAAWMGACYLILSLVPGLYGREVTPWLVPPIGRLVASTVNGVFCPRVLLAIVLHGLACLVLAGAVYRLRSRKASRRWP